MRVVAALILSLALGTPAIAGPDAAPPGLIKTKRFEVRFRPGSRAAADAARQAVAAERDLDRIATALDTAPKGPFVLWIYDDVGELTVATGRQGTGGHSFGNVSHVPYDNDQTRLHELVHLVTHEWPASGAEPRNLWFTEGIANAVLEYVHGVHVHAVAAHYARAGKLPAVAEMTGPADFYAWLRAHPGFNGYDVAASWMRFLLDTHGTAKVKRYYTGTPARTALGVDLPAAEKAWRAMLLAFESRPEVETLLEIRDGDPTASFVPFAEGVPAAVMGKPQEWTSIQSKTLGPERPSVWNPEPSGLLVATNDADEWTAAEFGAETYGDCVVRVRISTTGYTPVQVRFGADNQVLFVWNGTYLFRGDNGIADDPAVRLARGPTRIDVVVARIGSRIEAWVDGRKALSTEAGSLGARHVGVGLHKGTATFHDAEVRPIK
jgi:hypothetical protein